MKSKKTNEQLDKAMNIRKWIYTIVLYVMFITLILSLRFIDDNTTGFMVDFSLVAVIMAIIIAFTVEEIIWFKREKREIEREREERRKFWEGKE